MLCILTGRGEFSEHCGTDPIRLSIEEPKREDEVDICPRVFYLSLLQTPPRLCQKFTVHGKACLVFANLDKI